MIQVTAIDCVECILPSMTFLAGAESQAREFEDQLPLLDIPPSISLEDFTSTLVRNLRDRKLAPLIAAPDIPDTSAIDQIDTEFSRHQDSETWKTNVVLLVGMAAFKLLDFNKHNHDRAKPLHILGQPPRTIIQDYGRLIKSEPVLVKKAQIPLSPTWKHLQKTDWYRPEESQKTLGELKAIADRECISEVLNPREGPAMLNPKIAYWWSGTAHWQGEHQRLIGQDRLSSFHKEAHKELVHAAVLLALQQMKQNNFQGFDAIMAALRT